MGDDLGADAVAPGKQIGVAEPKRVAGLAVEALILAADLE